MSLRGLFLSCVLLPFAGTLPLAAQGWIHDLKSAPDTYLGQEVRVEGVVAGARAGASGGGGSYFLVDASDPTGIRVRTSRVPAEGGRFEVRGLLRRGEGEEGVLVLVETGRTRIGASPFLVTVATGSALLTLLLLLMFLRARRAERRHLLAAPLWLLPASDPSLAGQGGGAMRLDPSRDRTELAIATQLGRRRRRLLAAVGALAVATSSSAGWAAWAELSAGSRAVFWQPTGFSPRSPVPASPGPEPLTADSAPVQLVVAPPPPPPAPSPRVAGVLRPETAVAPSPPRPVPAPARDTASPPVTTLPVPVTLTELPPPRVLPLPPPPPPPTVVDSVTARAHREAQMALAAEAGLRGLHSRLFDAISRADRGELEALWPPGTGASGTRERFLDFVVRSRPGATLGPSESPTILGDLAQSKGTIAMTWRGDFGVTRTASATFVLALRRSGDSWTPEGVHLTARFP